MRFVSREAAARIMRERQKNLGSYSEEEIFRASATGADIPFAQSFQAAPVVDSRVVDSPPAPVAPPAPYVNRNSFGLYPFNLTNAAPQIVCNANLRRTFLLVQNQSASANVYFNLSGDAGLNYGVLLEPGIGVFFDVVCPNNSISIFVDSATAQPGIVMEGAHTT